MLKKNKIKIIISSIIILLPMLYGIIMWNDLPDIMTTHFGADGGADGFAGKGFAVFSIPCILLLLYIICLSFTMLDKKQKEQNPKALGMIFWIMPIISLVANGIMYRAAFGKEIDFSLLLGLLFGAMFIVAGNYLPKIKQNGTLGIKLSWTLHNEENWNKTHRLGGKIWFGGGLVLLVCAFLPIEASLIIMPIVIAAAVIIPVIYSHSIYKQHQKAGISYDNAPVTRAEKVGTIISAILIPLILIGAAVFMFTGEINVKCDETSLKINATYYTDIAVDYSDIDSVEYRKDFDVGIRTSGFGSARLSMGIFDNEEFGSYTLYSYTGAEEFVVLTSGKKTLVIGMKNADDTEAIYNKLSASTGEK